MDYLPVQNGSPSRDATTDRITRRNRSAGLWHITPVRRHLQVLAKHAHDHGVICLTQSRGILSHRVQNWLHISWGASDNAQDFTSCGLLLQDSLSFWNSRTFSIAMTAWSAKVSSSLICVGVNGRTSA